MNTLNLQDADPLALLDMKQVRSLVGLGASTIYEKVAAGRFPRAVKLGARTSRWRAGDVRCWLQSPLDYRAEAAHHEQPA